MKRITSLILTVIVIFLAITACGENPNRENASSSDKTVANTSVTSQNTNEEKEAPALTEQKPKDTVEIECHDKDSDYFVPQTDDWFLYSTNGCFVKDTMLNEDCAETQILYSFKTDGSLYAQVYKLVYKTPEAAQAAYDFMPDYPYTPAADSYNVFDKVLYFETGVLTYDKKSRFIEKMQDNSLVKDLGSGIYGYVMGGGAVWKKYKFSMLTSQ